MKLTAHELREPFQGFVGQPSAGQRWRQDRCDESHGSGVHPR